MNFEDRSRTLLLPVLSLDNTDGFSGTVSRAVAEVWDEFYDTFRQLVVVRG